MNRIILFFIIVTSLSCDKMGSLVSSKPLNVEYNDDLFYDDIIPDSPSRNAVRNSSWLWPDGKVYFKIQKGFDDLQIMYIRRAMNKISRVSCVRFIDAPENAKAYLYIKVSEWRCQSQIGYMGGITYLDLELHELDTGCFRQGVILHELMHALGFLHQHSVPDRDKYVKILFKNIRRDEFRHFFKTKYPVTNFGLPYDFGSIMHYPIMAYSKNGNRTIEPIADPGDVTIGQRKGLSKLDILKLNKLYKCCA